MKDAHRRHLQFERDYEQSLGEAGKLYTEGRQQSLFGHTENVTTVLPLPSSDLIVTTSFDNAVRLYSLSHYGNGNDRVSRKSMEKTLRSAEDDPDMISITPHRNPLWTKEVHEYDANCAAYLGDDVFATVGGGGNLYTWSTSGELVAHREVRRKALFCVTALGSTEMVIGTNDGELIFVSHNGLGSDLEESHRIRRAHNREIRQAVSFSEDFLVTASFDCSASVWNWRTRKCLARLLHRGMVFSATVSERYIATGSNEGVIRLFENNPSAGFPLRKLYRMKTRIYSLMFLPVNINRNILVAVKETDGVQYIDIQKNEVIVHVKTQVPKTFEGAIVSDTQIVVGGWGTYHKCVVVTLPDDAVRRIYTPGENIILPQPNTKNQQRPANAGCSVQ